MEKDKKEYEVNFILSSNILVDALDEDDAREIVNNMINEKIKEISEILYGVGIDDSDYTTDVIEL